jgi:DnaK suppressor protein
MAPSRGKIFPGLEKLPTNLEPSENPLSWQSISPNERFTAELALKLRVSIRKAPLPLNGTKVACSIIVTVDAVKARMEEPMKKKIDTRQENLQKLLLTKQETIISSIRKELSKRANANSTMNADLRMEEGDQALSNHEMYIDNHLLSMKNRQLKAIEAALVDLKENTYGICKRCGEEIDEKRLKALPFASLCIDCQREQEKTLVSLKENAA